MPRAKTYLAGSRRRLGDSHCSKSPRWIRGSVGFLIGTLLGGMVGGGTAIAITTLKFDITEPGEALKRAKNMTILASGITIAGAIGGLVIGSSKPEC